MNTQTIAPTTGTSRWTPRSLWKLLSAGLLVSSALVLLSGILYAISLRESEFSGSIKLRVRLEALSGVVSSPFAAALALGAVLALVQYTRVAVEPVRVRPAFAVAFTLAAALVVVMLFSVWDIATAHSSGVLGSLGSTYSNWNERLAAMLPGIASGTIAALAMALANRHAPTGVELSESPAIAAPPQD